MLQVAIAAEHAALGDLGEDATFRPSERRTFAKTELLRSRIDVMEVEALGCIFAAHLARLGRFELPPPLAKLVEAAPLPRILSFGVAIVPASP
jgi:hypothetical protein